MNNFYKMQDMLKNTVEKDCLKLEHTLQIFIVKPYSTMRFAFCLRSENIRDFPLRDAIQERWKIRENRNHNSKPSLLELIDCKYSKENAEYCFEYLKTNVGMIRAFHVAIYFNEKCSKLYK